MNNFETKILRVGVCGVIVILAGATWVLTIGCCALVIKSLLLQLHEVCIR